MNTSTLTSLLDYLRGTLSPSNMRWVGEHLIEYAEEKESLAPYTVGDLHQMVDEGKKQIEEGKHFSTEEVIKYCQE